MKDNELKNLILSSLKIYNPFVAVLDILIEYRDKSKFTEKEITKKLHGGSLEGGRLDNTHPLLRWSKDPDWELVKNGRITTKGIKYVEECKKMNVFYFHHTVDLKASRELNIITYLISKQSYEKIKSLKYEYIYDCFQDIRLPISEKELVSYIHELIDMEMPIELENKEIFIKDLIYHDITPKYYVKFNLNILDGINNIDVHNKDKVLTTDVESILMKLNSKKFLIIHDDNINLNDYPKYSTLLNYNDFFSINNELPNLKINTIIIPPHWRPLEISKINGILLSFIIAGGSLIIFHGSMGRIGSNRNLFNWLPYELSRISFIHSNLGDNKIKGFFTFPFGENFNYVIKKEYEEVGSGRYSFLKFKYGQGTIIFLGYNPSEELFSKYNLILNEDIKIDDKSIYWIYRYVPSINRSPTIKTEYQMYPLLKDIFKSNFNFEFDPDIKGKPGQTDLFIIDPFYCCCEVTPPSSNATGFSKVSEVHGHRETMIHKNKEKFKVNYVGACVLGPSFTIEDGYDKAGAVDMANALNVSLISYISLYELICFNSLKKINVNELEKIFFNRDGLDSEASIKIYNLIKKGYDGKI
ncbi:MAG TPA: hypothetical protein PKY52_05655 [Methanofastidiosum sp.]|nr:hypothetical protein [Methanofastidiosum sp.]HOT84566.1 hypothetical protein [Methanofastidiosum sp.]HQK85346.1 hypothetical protein [Methanofastidiosum sp.]